MNSDWMPRIDYFALAVSAARQGNEDIRKARADIEYLVTLYGPVEIARAARKGLENRNNGGPS